MKAEPWTHGRDGRLEMRLRIKKVGVYEAARQEARAERRGKAFGEPLRAGIRRQRNPVVGGSLYECIHGFRDSELRQVAGLLVCFQKVLQFGESRDAFVMAVNCECARRVFGSICLERAGSPMVN